MIARIPANETWGYQRIRGYSSSATASALHHPPNPQATAYPARSDPPTSWRGSCAPRLDLLAVDFFHVDCAITLKRISSSSPGSPPPLRHILGTTSRDRNLDHPTGHNLLMDLDDRAATFRFLVRDRAASSPDRSMPSGRRRDDTVRSTDARERTATPNASS
jgi:hypothetical protein